MDYRRKIAQNAIIFCQNELTEWTRALQQHPGLESLRPDKGRVLTMNLEAAKERLERLIGEAA